ncbi:hypothetical protein A2U01_0046767 [Trifolium medium]|uniref:Uncharacterized protein n=1 Tax=Trifolium medium TaxID=97028 RepID=A0A392QPW9_9FABA|nr:hypothetical protein [Trifolium medium]
MPPVTSRSSKKTSRKSNLLRRCTIKDSPLEPVAELPDPVVAEVELVVVQLSATARPASSPYDAFRPAPDVLGIDGALLVVAATTGPTY